MAAEEQVEPAPLLGTVDPAGRSLHLSTQLAAPPVQVWAALTRPDELAAWLGRVEHGPDAVGSRFAVEHDEDTRSQHVVTAWQPERLLAMTWVFPAEAESSVRFTLEAAGEGTRLGVVHEELADPVAYAAGWHRHLQYLGAHLTGADRPFEHFWDGYEDLVERYGAR